MAALVLAKLVGGSIQEVNDVAKVSDVKAKLSLGSDYTATVNGETADDATPLRENDYVTFAKATKGGF